jgi:hypothetical protein
MQKELVMAKMKGKLVLIPMGKKLKDMTNAEIDVEVWARLEELSRVEI